MITKYMISSEIEADYYLQDLLKAKEHRSISEITHRAQELIASDELRNYFINKGKEMLNSDE